MAIVIGVVLSIAWISAMLFRGSEQMHTQRWAIADQAAKSCKDRNEKDCSGVLIRAYFEAENRDRDTPFLLKPGVVEAFFPVLGVWLIAYGIVSAIRWVREGFRLDRAKTAGKPDADIHRQL